MYMLNTRLIMLEILRGTKSPSTSPRKKGIAFLWVPRPPCLRIIDFISQLTITGNQKYIIPPHEAPDRTYPEAWSGHHRNLVRIKYRRNTKAKPPPMKATA